MNFFIRLLFLPLGFFKQLFLLANKGARDLQYKWLYKQVIIGNGCTISNTTVLHQYVTVLSNSVVNNSKIESYSYVGTNCMLQNTTVGKFCSIANDVVIGTGKHPLHFVTTSPLFYRQHNPFNLPSHKCTADFEEYQPINVGHDVWIGTKAIIMDGISIGTGAVVAGGAVVTKNVPPYAIVAGVPAKIIKYRFSEDKIDVLLKSKWWENELKDIKAYMNEID